MDFREYLAIVWRRRWLILLTVLGTLAAAFAVLQFREASYRAAATIRVTVGGGGAVEYGDLLYGERLLSTYGQMVTSRSMISNVAQQLELSELPQVDVRYPANTELMAIEVEARDPVTAATMANTLAQTLIEQSLNTRAGRDNRATLIDPAVAPTSPAGLSPLLILALGGFVGLAGGVALALIVENFDTRFYTTARIAAATRLTVVGRIPGSRQRLWHTNAQRSPVAESYRQLRTSLQAIARAGNLQVLLISSAEPHEGKSTIVANLATVMAQAGRRVVVVDADMRLPTLHRLFAVPNSAGLSNVLAGEIAVDAALQQVPVAGMTLLPSGPCPAQPTEQLESTAMQKLMEDLRQRYDLVILDSPALRAVADAAVLAQLVDGVLLVVELSQSRREAVFSAVQQLRSLNTRLIGVVVNHAEQESASYYYLRKQAS